jgi:predicted TIM-barrel fold metal-dependent hydrolase
MSHRIGEKWPFQLCMLHVLFFLFPETKLVIAHIGSYLWNITLLTSNNSDSTRYTILDHLPR